MFAPGPTFIPVQLVSRKISCRCHGARRPGVRTGSSRKVAASGGTAVGGIMSFSIPKRIIVMASRFCCCNTLAAVQFESPIKPSRRCSVPMYSCCSVRASFLANPSAAIESSAQLRAWQACKHSEISITRGSFMSCNNYWTANLRPNARPAAVKKTVAA